MYLAREGALHDSIELSTGDIANSLATSQQTISRKLIELEEEGHIKRNPSTRGIKLRLTEKGAYRLKEVYIKLSSLFKEKMKSLTGTIESGLGEGSYYVSLKPYMAQFKEKLGFAPFPGTLNVRIELNDYLSFISAEEKITIEGFKAANRTFGSIIAYKIKLNGTDSAIIVPERTSHDKNIIEIISDVNFREKLKLKNTDKVTLSV
jgi:riboflavin kinase